MGMRVYRYRIINPNLGLAQGQQRGLVVANSLVEAQLQLGAQGWRVLSLRRLWWPLRWRLRGGDLLFCTQQLAVLLKAGLPLLAALALLAADESRPLLRAILVRLQDGIRQGQTLAQACAAYPEAFDALYLAMLAAGELSGDLTGALTALADGMAKRQRWHRQLRLALLYPSMILGLATALVLSLMLWVLPSFVVLYQGVGMALPAATARLLWLTELLLAYGWLLGLGVALAVWGGCRVCQRHRPSRLRLAQIGLRLPVFGRLRQQLVLARWAHTCAILYVAGVPLLRVLTSVAEVSHHLLYEQATLAVQQRVVEGQSLAQAMRHSPLFPELLVQLVGVGEEAGSLEVMLFRAAQHYEAEVDQTMALLSVWLEPVLLLVLGLIVGGVLLALYLPLFNIGDVIV